MILNKPVSKGKDARVSNAIRAMQDWSLFHPAPCLGSTAVGVCFEHLIGIASNNSPGPDYLGVEIKAKRIEPGNLLTLGCKNPRFPKKNKKEQYRGGRLRSLVMEHGQDGIHESGEFRRGLYQTIDNKSESEQQKFLLRDHKDGLELVVRKTGEVVAIWPKADFLDLIKKLTNLILVNVQSRKVKGNGPECFLPNKKGELIRIEEFRYSDFTYYWGFNPQKFYQMLLTGEAFVDLRAHWKHNVDKKAMRDHGTAFRLTPDQLAELYDGYEHFSLVDEVQEELALAA